MTRYILATIIMLVASTASASQRFVPPPAPQIVQGATIKVDREVLGSDQIIHLARSVPAVFHQFVGNYIVNLECSGTHPFRAQLSPRTSPMGSVDEELLFLTLPSGEDKNCLLTVVDRTDYPWKQVFHGSIGSIPEIAD